MELSLEVFVLLLLLLFGIIFSSSQKIKPHIVYYIIFYMAVFSLLTFFILFLIQRNKSIEKYTIYYDLANRLYSSQNIYNRQNCAIDGTCIITPDNTNLFPPNLLNLENNNLEKNKEQFNNYDRVCCKQGVDNKCNTICRGCKTGYCENGWCFSKKC